jgi:hypothetical protein
MRIASLAGIGFVLLTGCASESEIAPRTPVNAQLVRHEEMQNPDIRDGFMQVAEPSYAYAPPPAPRKSISLGFIGDEPLGRYATPEHRDPSWTRPFPCHWTHTCWVPPQAGYGRRYAPYPPPAYAPPY